MRWIGWLVVLALLISGGAYAQSNPPAPSPLIVQQPPQTEPAKPQNATEPDKRGTEQAPVVVKVLPAPIDAEDAAQAKQEAREKASNDRSLVELTGALAIATFALVAVTAGLWLATRKILKETRDSSQKQIGIARETLIAQTRPWLTIERIQLERFNIDENSASFSAIFVIKNIGASPAFRVLIQPTITTDMTDAHNYGSDPSSRNKLPQLMGETIFQGTTHTSLSYSFGMSKDEILAIHASGMAPFLTGSSPEWMEEIARIRPVTSLYYLKVVVRYEFIGSKLVHETAETHMLSRPIAGTTNSIDPFPFPIGTVDVAGIRITRFTDTKAD